MGLRFGVRAAGSLELPFAPFTERRHWERKFGGGMGENSTVKILDKISWKYN